MVNIKKEIAKKEAVEKYKLEQQQIQTLKDKVIKLANKLNIVIIESDKGILLFKPNIKNLRLQNSKEFVSLIDSMDIEKFNKCVNKEINKIYEQPLNILDMDYKINTYKEIYNYLIKLNTN